MKVGGVSYLERIKDSAIHSPGLHVKQFGRGFPDDCRETVIEVPEVQTLYIAKQSSFQGCFSF